MRFRRRRGLGGSGGGGSGGGGDDGAPEEAGGRSGGEDDAGFASDVISRWRESSGGGWTPWGRRWAAAAAAVAAAFLVGYLAASQWLLPAPSRAEADGLVQVPELVDLSVPDARARAEEAGLRAAVSHRVAAGPGDEGRVLAQRPLPGQAARPGDTVRLSVARDTPAVVPRIRGLSREQGREVLERLGFRVEVETEPSSARKGEVIGTRPRAGAPAPPSSAVTLRVSEGPPVVEVPGLVGLHVNDVSGELEEAGLRLGAVDYDESAPGAPGRVVAQTPPAGFALREGERVRVRVAGSPPDTLAPPGGGG